MADVTTPALPSPASRGEALLIAAARAGTEAQLAALKPAERVVRGALLRALLEGDNADGRRTPAGLRLSGALVAGPVLLDGLGGGGAPAAPLWLRHCAPAEGAGIPFLARGAGFAELDLSHSRLARLEARGLHCAALTLTGLAIATGDGRVDLEGARLTGPAFLAGIGPARDGQGWPLLNLAGARVAGHLRLAGARLRELVLVSTVVHGDVQLDGAQLHAAGAEPALLGNTARISGALRLHGVQVQGQLRLLKAEVGGAVLLGHGARLHQAGGVALLADGATLGGLLVQDGAEVVGEIRALGAKLSGGVVLDAGARLTMPGGDALALDGASLGGGVLLAGARLEGSLSLRRAKLSGDLALTAGSLVQAPHHAAVAAGEAAIGGNLLLQGATLLGRLDLAGASIGGALRAEGLDLAAGPGLLTALDGAGLRAGAVTLGGARVAGQIRLDRAMLAEGLELSGLALAAAPAAAGAVPLADPEVLLSLKDAQLGQRLAVSALPAETEGVFDLRGAVVAVLADAGGAGWGVSAGRGGVRLRLEGFGFQRLAEIPGGRRAARDLRLGFLLRQFRGGRPNAAEFCGPAFTQVAQALRRDGHGADADWFARARRRVRRQAGVTERPLGAWADGLAGMFFGDFYSARRTLVTFGLFLLLGAGGLWAANIQGVLLNRGADASPCWMPAELPQVQVMDAAWPMPDRSAGLEALRMAVDLAVPGIPLHWAERCEVAGDSIQAVAWGWAWRLYQVLGGALLLLGAAGLTGLFRRD
jgi:hypothetical protein